MPRFELSSRSVIAAFAAVLLTVAGGYAAFNQTPAASASTAATPPQLPVITVKPEPVAQIFEFSARFTAVESVEIRPRLSAVITGVHFREGQTVRAGDVLFTLDQAPFRAELDRARAGLSAAQARHELALSERQRAERLLADNAIARSEADRLIHAEKTAKADRDAAQAQVTSAELNLSYTRIRAPIAGRVGRVNLTAGNLVSAGGAVLTTVVSVSPVYADFDMDETALRQLAPQRQTDAIHVKAEINGESLNGRLYAVDNRFDATTGTVKVRAIFNHSDHITPGQFVRLHLSYTDPEPSIILPESAIGTDQDRRFVYVVGKDNSIVYRQVTTGRAADGKRVITGGLIDGERIVTSGLHQVRAGAKITPQIVTGAAPGVAPGVAQ